MNRTPFTNVTLQFQIEVFKLKFQLKVNFGERVTPTAISLANPGIFVPFFPDLQIKLQ